MQANICGPPPPSSSLPLCPTRLQRCIYSHPPHPLSCAARRLWLCYACSLQACPVGTPLVPCCVTTSLDWFGCREASIGRGVLSGLCLVCVVLFNISLVVLCLNTLLCLCLCLPCVPVIPPPCSSWSHPLV